MELMVEIRPEERNDLFVRKLQQCKVVFDFNDASAELQGKQVKAQTLHEMLEYITQNRGVVTEQIYPEVVNMVCPLLNELLVADESVCRQLVPIYPASGQPYW